MRFWIFGDSFAMDHGQEQQWQHQLAKHYRCEALIDAYYGFSNERIFMNLENHLDQFAETDWIIVTGTQETRHWFFPDYPEYSNFVNIVDMDNDPLSAEQHTALDYYGRYLFNESVDAFNYYCQTHWLDAVCAARQLNLIYLPGFANTPKAIVPGVAHVVGTLTEDVSQLEFATQQDRRQWYAQHRPDSRANHLSAHNHSILATKIKNVIDGATDVIDLTQDFETGFLTARSFSA